MKLVFVTNYYNHHQASVAQEMYELTGHSYVFIETEAISAERLSMGWGREEKPSYVLQAYKSKEEKHRCLELIYQADVVIWGSCPFSMLRRRLRAGRLTFAYSERIFKQGFSGVPFCGRAIKYFLKLAPYQKNHFLLCASSYAAGDYNRIALFRGRCFKWGYFPPTIVYTPQELFSHKAGSRKCLILWAGRLIDVKHPEVPVLLAERLRHSGLDFQMKILGSGALEPQVKSMVEEKGLSSHVEMLGAMPPQAVRQHMECADIFLFTSDCGEGWGAVLNESMNSGCAVVASSAAGSSAFLIKDGENGFIYENGNLEDLFSKVSSLIVQPEMRRNMGIQACHTISDKWNASVAAKRVIELSDALLKSAPLPFSEGICSVAR